MRFDEMTAHDHPVSAEELMAYLDGEVSAARGAVLAAHLQQCASCAHVVGELRRTSGDLAAWAVEAAPPMPTPALTREPASTPPARSPWTVPRGWKLAAVAASLAVVIALPVLFDMERYAVAPNPMVAKQESVAAASRADSAAPTASAAPPMRAMMEPAAKAPSGALVRQTASAVSGPQVARTAVLTLVLRDVDSARVAIELLLARVGGFAANIEVAAGEERERRLTGRLHVPAPRLGETLKELRALGRVAGESQSAEDVTEQITDVGARLANGRTTEQRLAQILRTRTGNVEEVLQVERELARVREEIEGLDRDQRDLQTRVSHAVISVIGTEEPKPSLEATGLAFGQRLRNARVEGLGTARDTVLELILAIVEYGPVLLLAVLVLWWPVRKIVRLAVVASARAA